jgi:PccH Cytochrome c
MLRSNIIILYITTILPACAIQQVSYKEDVHPILDSNCNGCHTAPYGYGYQKTGLEMDSYHSLMKGTFYGPVVIAGDSRRSILNKLVEGRAGSLQKILHDNDNEAISQVEVETIKVWVDEGALNN